MYKKNFEEKNLVPWDPPGVPRVPIFGPNRGMFSKLNWPGPLGSGGHSHAIFSNGRFRGAQRSFGGDVQRKCILKYRKVEHLAFLFRLFRIFKLDFLSAIGTRGLTLSFQETVAQIK